MPSLCFQSTGTESVGLHGGLIVGSKAHKIQISKGSIRSIAFKLKLQSNVLVVSELSSFW